MAIATEHQYQVTKQQLQNFRIAIKELTNSTLAGDETQKIRYKADLEFLHSQIEEFQEEI